MSGVAKYKLALLKENKRYLITVLLLFVLILFFVCFALTFRTTSSLDGDLQSSLNEYSKYIDSQKDALERGVIDQRTFNIETASYQYLLSNNKAKWMYFDNSMPIEGHEVSCAFYFMATLLFPLFSCFFGVATGGFAFSFDFSSKRIKNILSSNKDRKKLFNDTLLLSFLFDLGFSILPFLLMFFFTIPIHGYHILRQINELVFEHSVLEVVLIMFLVCLVCSFLFTMLTSFIGILLKENLMSLFVPTAIVVILFLTSMALTNDKNYDKEIICNYFPFSSLTTLPFYGSSYLLWIALSIHLVFVLLLLFINRRLYEKADI